MGNHKKIILEPSLMFIDNRNHTQIYEIAGFWSFNGFIVGPILREPPLNLRGHRRYLLHVQGKRADKKLPFSYLGKGEGDSGPPKTANFKKCEAI